MTDAAVFAAAAQGVERRRSAGALRGVVAREMNGRSSLEDSGVWPRTCDDVEGDRALGDRAVQLALSLLAGGSTLRRRADGTGNT